MHHPQMDAGLDAAAAIVRDSEPGAEGAAPDSTAGEHGAGPQVEPKPVSQYILH